MSERIVNIAELEDAIRNAKFNFDVLYDEFKKNAPSKEIINGASNQVKMMLDKASEFEFRLEKRKTVIPEIS